MNKCLVTSLKGIISDSSLIKAGEIRIDIKDNVAPGYFVLQSSKEQAISIIGEGYFTDNSGSVNNGKTMVLEAYSLAPVYLSGGNYKISIPDKYALLALNASASLFDLSDLRYCKEMIDITVFSDITGDLSSLANLTNLHNINLTSTQITGDLSSLENLVNVASFTLNTQQLKGDLSSLAKMSNLATAWIGSAITGDASKLPNSTYFLSTHSNLSWTNRDVQANILALENVTLSNVDQMLQNQAQCVKPTIEEEKSWFRVISVYGTRTTASDAAVAALQSKGYTVSVSPVL